MKNAHDHSSLYADGSVLALWQHSSEGVSSLWWNLFSPLAGWSEARKLADDVAGNAKLASNAKGDAVAVWTATLETARARDFGEAVWASQFQSHRGRWTAPSQIDALRGKRTATSRVSRCPQMAAPWLSWETHAANTIWSNHFHPTAGWQGAQVLDHGNGNLVDSPRVGADTRGRFVTTWRRYDQAETALWVRHYRPGAGWQYPQQLTDDVDGRVHDHRLAVSETGDAIALWSQGNARHPQSTNNCSPPATVRVKRGRHPSPCNVTRALKPRCRHSR